MLRMKKEPSIKIEAKSFNRILENSFCDAYKGIIKTFLVKQPRKYKETISLTKIQKKRENVFNFIYLKNIFVG